MFYKNIFFQINFQLWKYRQLYRQVSEELDDLTTICAQELLPLIRHIPMEMSDRTSKIMIMASVCARAMTRNQPVLVVSSTLKLKPDHLDAVPDTNTMPCPSINVGGESLQAADIRTLDDNEWLNDKVSCLISNSNFLDCFLQSMGFNM